RRHAIRLARRPGGGTELAQRAALGPARADRGEPVPPLPERLTMATKTPETPELTFEHFLLSLATAALVHLGEVEHPETKKKSVNLTVAKQNIDILGM